MDRIDIYKKAANLLSRYKYAILILAFGILLMSLPNREPADTFQEPSHTQEEISPAAELEEILAEISGVGKVKVMLTEAAGEQIFYQTDEDHTKNADTESLRIQTVIVTKADREEAGLVRSVRPPVYRGAIIVCEGGHNPSVKLSIVQAVSNVTGISSDRITVLKMK